MKIESQIKCLLARYGKVSLPSQGIFMCVSEGAKIEDGKLFPPTTKVVFEKCDAGYDRMLIEMVMEQGEMKKKEAYDLVRNAHVDIDEIVGHWDYLPQNYGLLPVDMPQVRVMPVKWLDVKYIAVVAVAALLNIMIPFNGVRNDLNEAGIGLGSMQKIVMPVDEVPIDEKMVQDEEDVVVREMKYVLVVASFQTQEAAIRFLMEKNVPGAVEIIEKDGRFRVCGMRFAEYNEANQYIRENSLNAWVMKL